MQTGISLRVSLTMRKLSMGINHKLLIKIFKKYNIDGKDLHIMKSLYWNQSENIKLGSEYLSTKRQMKSGVRKGCPLSQPLFNIYADQVMKEVD